MAQVGQIIDGKYEILKEVGKGGMSRVYLAMDQRLNKQWAVKEIQKRGRDENNEYVIQSAIAEANLIKSLDHPSIVRITDIIENDDVIYIVEDYIEGETLASVLKREGEQPQERVIEWAIQLCEALQYLHSRTPAIIYRDMKPGNVMLRPEGTIKIIDFGIAREYKAENLEDTTCLGTRGYAAPEQFGGKGQTDARTDIYCLGATLYHLLTGKNPAQPPYEMYPIRYWNPELSAGLEAIILRCTQNNPRDRYNSCEELLYALQHYEEYSVEYRAMQMKKIKRFAFTAGLSVVFIILGIVSMVIRTSLNNQDYDQNIIKAENATDTKEALEYYKTAVDIKPNEPRTYFDIVDALKTDAAFTMEEDKYLKGLVNNNLEGLRNRDEYASLAFEIGKLYWYYYDYGKSEGTDNSATRMKSAIQWFDDAVSYGNENDEFYQMAKVYSEIGKFNRDITLNIQEASDKGKYASYWNNIKELVNYMNSSTDNNEFVQLEVCRLVYSSIETYARKLRADGVSQDDMISEFNLVTNMLNSMQTTSDTTEAIKRELMSRTSEVQSAINNAFRE